MVESGNTKDLLLNACIRHIWLITVNNDIDLHIVHVEGHTNVTADALSRIFSHKGIPWHTFHDVKVKYIWDKVPPHYFSLDFSI